MAMIFEVRMKAQTFQKTSHEQDSSTYYIFNFQQVSSHLDNIYFIFPCHIVKLPPLVKKGGDVMLDFPPDLHPPPPKKHAVYLEKGKTIMALSKCIAICCLGTIHYQQGLDVKHKILRVQLHI